MVDTFKQLAGIIQQPDLKHYCESFQIKSSIPLSEAPLLALDFETTGLDPNKDDILSIGAIPMTLNGIQFGQGKYWVLKPASKLQADTVIIHGITHTDIEQAPDLTDILPELLQIMSNRIVVAHYCFIEREFFASALEYRFGESLHIPCIDTLAIEKAMLSQPAKGWRNKLSNWFKPSAPQSVRLADTRTRYGLPLYKQHHALYDALACGELLQAQAQRHGLTAKPLESLLSKASSN